MSYLHYLCLLAYSGVENILCCFFILFFFAVLWTICCQFLSNVNFLLPLRYSLMFIESFIELQKRENCSA